MKVICEVWLPPSLHFTFSQRCFLFSMTCSRFRLLYLVLFFTKTHYAQETFPVNGPANPDLRRFHLKNVRVYRNDRLEGPFEVQLSEGKIWAVGAHLTPFPGARDLDLSGRILYPAFVEAYGQYGLPETKSRPGDGPQPESRTKGAFSWNEALHTEQQAARAFVVQPTQAEEWRNAGFGAINTYLRDGISRGSSCLVFSGDGKEHLNILQAQSGHALSFEKGSSAQDYPSSLMGSMALIRQTVLDAQWYSSGGNQAETNLSLQAWCDLQGLPQLMECRDKYTVLRALQLAKSMGLNWVVKTGGDDYQVISSLVPYNPNIVIPLSLPATPDVEDPSDAALVEIADLMHWEAAPWNAFKLWKAGISFSFTTLDMKSRSEVWNLVRKVLDTGVPFPVVMDALTTKPAAILGQSKTLGRIEPGFWANFLVCSDTLFKRGTEVQETWVKGIAYARKSTFPLPEPGLFRLSGPWGNAEAQLSKQGNGLAGTALIDNEKVKVTVEALPRSLNISLSNNAILPTALLPELSPSNAFSGAAQSNTGVWQTIRLERVSASAAAPDTAQRKTTSSETEPSVPFPFGPYGFLQSPTYETVLFRGATVWTGAAAGVMAQADVLIRKGKIAAIGSKLEASDARVVEAKGLHLTPGIVDEHSHIAISGGVNEMGQASTAEVRIGDVVNADDVNIYRQLAGGVTAAQLLHGSANPIGGQSALVKLRWGEPPARFPIEGADGFIKFALGENVKQSNAGDRYTVRYPQSRMGVEQTFLDAFSRARRYEQQKKEAGKGPFRRDLDLETISDVISGKRFITCHAYQQGEMTMLMNLADSFGFRVNTFTHVLEGYKIADRMKRHGVGASTFSDWWAYKFEVMEAIPHNASLMHRMGLVVAINSDDAEMGRRLNQEAAKSMKYGGLSSTEALALCTTNPARLLHLDKWTGTLEVGKDADLVLWSADPLSIASVVQQTWVDGVLRYSAERDAAMRKTIVQERQRLVQKALKSKKNGGKTEPVKIRKHRLYHCDDIERYGE